ncbi:excinuclease ABC subunit UvrC [uncultured Desulfuromusa sp.]|uniref:excinuclease ABC subunit UvrC n=1 Tax=uncultured Desulfuromusa sp. TaxID=219183 RepID=UPI002AA5FAC6|nr:excinuclease ABC subunit UvrC [uncultured Desulfuromusa sp.]
MISIDLKKYPLAPGVYQMFSKDDEVLYVGKAKLLRNRLRSYFSARGDGRLHIPLLMEKVQRIEVIITDTEKEALLLENTLIKKYRPHYNIDLRDDKTYVSVRIDLNDPFPMMQVVRQVKNDGAHYFGPYSSASAIRETLKEIYRIFPLRHSSIARCRKRGRPCLFHQIGQCSAPCHGKISQGDYRKLVEGVIQLLEGRESEVIAQLQQRMGVAAEEMRFEDAARLRDQINAIEKSIEKQKVTEYGGGNQDVIGLHEDGGEVEVTLLFVRHGRLIGRRSYPLEWKLDLPELLSSFLQEYYSRQVILPDQLLLPFSLESAELLGEWLSEKRGKKVRLLAPQRGEKKRLCQMAQRNAAESYRQRGQRKQAREGLLEELRVKFHLPCLPARIECYDISNVQGNQSVGSMVVLLHGEPAKAEYRRFKIKTVEGADDYASLLEVLRRRLSRGVKESVLPDMILIDGGKGQLGVLTMVLDEFNLQSSIGAVGIAKSRVMANVRGKAVERSEERFFLPGRKNPVSFRHGSASLFLLQRLRDEAHRFAITYHRKLRNKASLRSSLEDIPGVGPSRRKALLKHFGSLKKIRSASLEQLQQMPGMPAGLAETIFRVLQEK